MNKNICGFDIGIKNLAFCILTKTCENKLIDINEWTNINLIEDNENKKCMKINPQILYTSIFNALNKYESFKTLNEVRIENQPALINPTMK
jgi:hypothetical protein